MPLSQDVKQMAVALKSSLREKNIEISYGECLDIVAKQFRLKDWNVFSALLKRDDRTRTNLNSAGRSMPGLGEGAEFRALFPEAPFAKSGLDVGVKTYHPFPHELVSISELVGWRRCWELNPVSTRQVLFFPPMPPLSCFSADDLEIEFRRDWHLDEKGSAVGVNLHHFANGHCCALLRAPNRELAGAMSWCWWGANGVISGVGVVLYLLFQSRWIRVSFDMRGGYAKPTYGPNVSYEAKGSLSSLTKAELISMVTLDLYRCDD